MGSWRGIEDVLQMQWSLERDVVRIGLIVLVLYLPRREEISAFVIFYCQDAAFSPQRDNACCSRLYLRLSQDSPLLSSRVHSDLSYQISHCRRECKKRGEVMFPLSFRISRIGIGTVLLN